MQNLEAQLAVALSDLAAAIRSRDQAIRSARAELEKRVALESQLGQADAEIARLEGVLRQAAHMFTIIGARKVIADALGEKDIERTIHRRRSRVQR